MKVESQVGHCTEVTIYLPLAKPEIVSITPIPRPAPYGSSSTANLSADIVSFARSQGLYGGIALDGTVVKVRNGLNKAYYHKKKLTPTDIFIRRTVTNPQAENLTKAVATAVEGKLRLA